MVLGTQLRQNEEASCADVSNRIRKRTQTVIYHTSAKGQYGQTHSSRRYPVSTIWISSGVRP
jgi:hypothetical protein